MKMFIAITMLALAAGAAWAADMPPASMERPLQAPSVPKAIRDQAIPTTATRGPALRDQVEKKLKVSFDAAATRDGTLTKEQAGAGGLGFIAQHFEAIDTRKTGLVRFEDVKVFLRARGAELD